MIFSSFSHGINFGLLYCCCFVFLLSFFIYFLFFQAFILLKFDYSSNFFSIIYFCVFIHFSFWSISSHFSLLPSSSFSLNSLSPPPSPPLLPHFTLHLSFLPVHASLFSLFHYLLFSLTPFLYFKSSYHFLHLPVSPSSSSLHFHLYTLPIYSSYLVFPHLTCPLASPLPVPSSSPSHLLSPPPSSPISCHPSRIIINNAGNDLWPLERVE